MTIWDRLLGQTVGRRYRKRLEGAEEVRLAHVAEINRLMIEVDDLHAIVDGPFHDSALLRWGASGDIDVDWDGENVTTGESSMTNPPRICAMCGTRITFTKDPRWTWTILEGGLTDGSERVPVCLDCWQAARPDRRVIGEEKGDG